MNVLITGATGFIGSHVTRQLVSEGERVVAFELAPTMARIDDIKDKVELVRGDICDLEVLMSVFKKYKIDHVIHIAAYLPEAAIRENPTKAIRVNLEGTNNIFEASRILDVQRVVYASTDAVNPHGLEEDAVVTPTSIYAHLKYMNEVMGRHFNEQFGLETIGFRFCANYGPGGRLIAGEVSRRYASGALFSAFESALRGERVVTPLPREFAVDWIYVKDNARLLSLALSKPYPKRKVFNTPGERNTLAEVADVIKRIVPSSEIRFGADITALNQRVRDTLTIDIGPVKEAFGYEPKYTLEDGLREYHNDMVKNPHLYETVS